MIKTKKRYKKVKNEVKLLAFLKIQKEDANKKNSTRSSRSSSRK